MSFSAERRKLTAYRGIFLQAALHFVQWDQWLVPTAGDNCQVVQVFQQLLIFCDWQDDGGSFAVLYHVYGLGIQDAHCGQSIAADFQTQLRGSNRKSHIFVSALTHSL